MPTILPLAARAVAVLAHRAAEAGAVDEPTAVEVRWPLPFDVPFELRAVYRWHDATPLDVHLDVRAVDDLPAFEVFFSSYFDAGFAHPLVYVEHPKDAPKFLPGEQSLGYWLMTPRDDAAGGADPRRPMAHRPASGRLSPLCRPWSAPWPCGATGLPT